MIYDEYIIIAGIAHPMYFEKADIPPLINYIAIIYQISGKWQPEKILPVMFHP